MSLEYLDVVNGYVEFLKKETGTPVIIAPSEVKSERFHVELSLLPHPVIVGNGLVRFRLRATVFAEIPASNPAINDCLEQSLKLARFFDDAQGFLIAKAGGERRKNFYGMAYHTALRDDDDLFADLSADERSYSYAESWLVELEFNDLEFNLET
ncbi:MAG: hypothetical protein P1P64_03490 [Treponemataceae bacterium]